MADSLTPEARTYTDTQYTLFRKVVDQLQADGYARWYTVDSAAAYQVAEQLQPQVVVPMHYRRGDVGLKEIDTVDAFLARFPAGMVHTYGASLELRPGMERQVAVMSL